jgi:hypothetical protein
VDIISGSYDFSCSARGSDIPARQEDRTRRVIAGGVWICYRFGGKAAKTSTADDPPSSRSRGTTARRARISQMNESGNKEEKLQPRITRLSTDESGNQESRKSGNQEEKPQPRMTSTDFALWPVCPTASAPLPARRAYRPEGRRQLGEAGSGPRLLSPKKVRNLCFICVHLWLISVLCLTSCSNLTEISIDPKCR